MNNSTTEFFLNQHFAAAPYRHAPQWVASVHQGALKTNPQYDMAGMDAIAAGGHTAATLLGLFASNLVATAAQRERYYDAGNRQPAFRLDIIDEITEPTPANAVVAESKAHERKVQTWVRGQQQLIELRAAIIASLPPTMRDHIMNNPVPRLEIVDILAMVQREYIDTRPSTVTADLIKDLESPLTPDTPVDASFQHFDGVMAQFQDVDRPQAYHTVNHYLRKLDGAELTNVLAALRISHATDASRHWNDDIKRIIREQILGTREHPNPTVGHALAHHASAETTNPAPVATAAAAAATTRAPQPAATARPTHYCFAHGRCSHTSFECTKMHTDYGDVFDNTNPHRAKFLCTTPGQNVDGVISSSRVPGDRHPTPPRNRSRRGGRGRGRG